MDPILKAHYDTEGDIPDEYRALYEERDGKWEVTGIAGLRSNADVDRLTRDLRKERDEHKKTRDKLQAWSELGDADELRDKLDRIEELETAADGKLDEAKIGELVETRMKARTAQMERNHARVIEERDRAMERLREMEGNERRRTIHDETRKALSTLKVEEWAHEDALLHAERCCEVSEDGAIVTRDGVGVTPGQSVREWLEADVIPKRPGWVPQSVGAGPRGGRGGGQAGGPNPWRADQWNLAKQAEIMRANPQEAERKAAAAGSKIGALMPPAQQAK